jgi:Circularly permutated YpsA SLOG family
LDTGEYAVRTKQNVVDADAALAFTEGELAGGTRMTIDFARECKKPYLHINLKKYLLKTAWMK